MQIMPYTAVKISRMLQDDTFTIDRLKDPLQNMIYGSIYLKFLINHFNDLVPAIAAYNAGPRMVSIWLDECKGCSTFEFVELIPYRETRRYVKKIFEFYGNYLRIYKRQVAPIVSIELPKHLPPSDNVF